VSVTNGGGAWRSAAACAGLGPALFYDPNSRAVAAAKRICATCPVSFDCAEHARTANETFGVWGGQTETDRAQGPTVRTVDQPGPVPFVPDDLLIALFTAASPAILAIDVLRRELDVCPAAAYKYLIRALRLGLVERRGRNLYPVRRS
jgi:WhiB family transcriptional regulator, redox-sensing transcriptional regulator